MQVHELFSWIASVQPSLDGWCELEKANILASAVLTLRPAVTVEIGVFGGKSLIPMTLACEVIGSGIVIGIDPWTVAAATEGYVGENLEWWAGIDHESIYQRFLGSLHTFGIESRVDVWRAKSDDVTPPSLIDLLHVDGQHTDQAVRDVERFGSNVRLGGLCCLDDIAWQGGGVERAAQALERLGFDRLYELGTGAMFQRALASR